MLLLADVGATVARLRAIAAALAALGLTSAPAEASGIRLQSTFAGPIATSNQLCTAEPRGLVYGTANFNPGQPLSHTSIGIPLLTYYEPGNAPSYLDLVPQYESAARSDLCVGFTLPPNVEPKLERDVWDIYAPRLQDDPAWPDVSETHTSSYPSGSTPVHGDDLRGLTLTLPAGYAADFASAARCDAASFAESSFTAPTCPAASRVGDAFFRVSAYASGNATHATLTTLAINNLAPAAGDVGRLGVSFKAHASLAPVKWVFAVRYARDGSGRLVATLADAARLTYDATAIANVGDAWGGNGSDLLQSGDPRVGQPQPSSPTRPLYVEGANLRLWGSKTAHASMVADFGAQSGRCTAATSAAFDVNTYAGTQSAATGAAFTLTDCSSLTLPAAASVTLTDPSPGAATGATVDVDFPQSGTRLPAQPSAITIALPDGVELGPQLASASGGQAVCTGEQFLSGSASEPAPCSEATAVGTATLEPFGSGSAFSGPVFLGPPANDEDLAALLFDVAQPGTGAVARLKLSAAVRVGDSGQLSVDLDDLPATRLAGIGLTLRGGAHALLTAPDRCGNHTGSISVERPLLGATESPITLDTAGCEDPAAPTLVAAGTSPRSGDRPATSLTVRRSGPGSVERLTLGLPTGTLVATSAIPTCEAADASAGTCSPDSQIGTVRLAAGAGAAPLEITGTVHLSAAPSGALAGVVVQAPVELGGLTLGRLVGRGELRAGLSAASTTFAVDLPSRIGGVALDLHRVAVDLDRAGVVRQPTSCGALDAAATVTTAGIDAHATSTATYPGCAAQSFAPAFAASVSGETAVGGHPKLVAVLTPNAADAALSGVRLVLPSTLAFDSARAGSACAEASFNAGDCAVAAKIGQASEKVAVEADTVGADAHLVRTTDGSLAIGLAFGGAHAHRALGRISTSGGANVVTFSGLPDLPLERWALQLDGGTNGALTIAKASNCTKSVAWSAELIGQNGAQVQRAASAPCPSGGAAATAPEAVVSVSAKTGIKLKLTKFGSLDLQTVKLTMPKAIRINAPKAKRRGRAPFALIGAKGATPAFTSGSITLSPWGGAPSEVVARLRTTAYTVGGRTPERAAGTLKGKRRNAEFGLRLGFRDGSVQNRKITVRLP